MLQEAGTAALEPWQLGFCKWLAAHPNARVKEQEAMASELAGTPVYHVNIKNLRATKSFRNWYSRYQAKILQRLDAHREAFETENVGEAVKAHKWALERAQAEDDYQAIPALAAPAIKALYKHIDEQQDKPMIVVNLGGASAQRLLNAPPIDVEYEELPPGEEEHDQPGI